MSKGTKTTRGARTAAVERVIAGLSTDHDEARKLRISVRRFRAWVTMAKNDRERITGSAPEILPPEHNSTSDLFGSSSAEEERRPSPDLDTARESAGLGGTAGAPGDDPASAAGTPPGSAPSGPAVVALASVIREQALKLYAGIVKLDPTDPRVRAVCVLSAEQKEALAPFAPSVASYFPSLFGGDDARAGAVAFAGIFVLGLWNSTGELKAMSKAERARPAPPLIPAPREPAPVQAHENGADIRPSGIPPTAQGPGAIRSIY